MRTESFSGIYWKLLYELVGCAVSPRSDAYEERNARTGVVVRALPGGQSFKLDLSEGRLPMVGNRRTYPRIAAAEVAWQFMGTQDPAFVMEHAPKLWSKFIEGGKLLTAYGYRWRKHFGRDQLGEALAALAGDGSYRRAYISSWDPARDGLTEKDQPKNLPCPVGFSITRQDKTLHMSFLLRSSDVFVGLPYDVMSYALTQRAIASELGCEPGTLHVTLAHAHIYEPHFEMARRSLDLNVSGGMEPWMPTESISQILADPHKYVAGMADLARSVPWHEYDPKPDVVL